MKGIECKNVSKHFGSIQALQQIDLKLEAGKIYGLLGRNGAGKSTLLNVMSRRLKASKGTVLIDGESASKDESLQKMYHVGPDSPFYSDKAEQILKTSKLFYPNLDLEGAEQDALEYELNLKSQYNKLSTGNASIFKTIIALRSGAEYLLLDEPTMGMDAPNRETFYEKVLKTFAETGSTILLSSHLIDELAPLVQEVIFLDHGRIILQGEVESLLHLHCFLSGPRQELDQYLSEHKDLEKLGEKNLASYTHYLLRKGPKDLNLDGYANLRMSPVSLQDLFVALTKRKEN